MSGDDTWFYIGTVVALIGVVLPVLGVSGVRRQV
jgi:hypothetical protein